MKLATYSTPEDVALRVGLVLDIKIVPLVDNGIEGDMTSLLEAGIDNDAIEAATTGKSGLPPVFCHAARTRSAAR